MVEDRSWKEATGRRVKMWGEINCSPREEAVDRHLFALAAMSASHDYTDAKSLCKHQAGLQSFRSMRRIEASRRNASALRLEFLPILGKPRATVRPAKVRSTSQRRGSTSKSFHPIGALDDFSFELRQDLSPRLFESPAPGSRHRQRAFSRKDTSRKGSPVACRHHDLEYRQDE